MRIENLLLGGSDAGLPTVEELAGLVVMGGPMNADDTDRYPALKVERELLRSAVRAQVPTLGVCLGAQLLARAMGMAVLPGSEPEIGWGPLTAVDADDPVVGPLAGAPGVLHWHDDRIDPGPDVAVLARTPGTACQAFRVGRSAWGLQFHPEVTPELLDEWLAEPLFARDAERALGSAALHRLRVDARMCAPPLRPLALRGFGHFRLLVQARL